MSPSNYEPIQWPRIQVGKQLLEVKWSLFAEYLLSTWGLDVSEVIKVVASTRKILTPAVVAEDGTVQTPAVLEPQKPEWVMRFFDLFAACVGQNYVDMGQEAPKAAHWAAVMQRDQFQPALKALVEAMGKPQTPVTPTPDAGVQAVKTEPVPVVQ